MKPKPPTPLELMLFAQLGSDYRHNHSRSVLCYVKDNPGSCANTIRLGCSPQIIHRITSEILTQFSELGLVYSIAGKSANCRTIERWYLTEKAERMFATAAAKTKGGKKAK